MSHNEFRDQMTYDTSKAKEEERCFHCDRNAYHKNDRHCGQGKEKEEEDYCGCLGEEGSGVCDDCDCGADIGELNGVKENPVEAPPMVWDENIKQSIVEVKCGSCKTVYKDRQSTNDCVSLYPYEYPKKGCYWMENKECYKCYKKNLTKN